MGVAPILDFAILAMMCAPAVATAGSTPSPRPSDPASAAAAVRSAASQAEEDEAQATVLRPILKDAPADRCLYLAKDVAKGVLDRLATSGLQGQTEALWEFGLQSRPSRDRDGPESAKRVAGKVGDGPE